MCIFSPVNSPLSQKHTITDKINGCMVVYSRSKTREVRFYYTVVMESLCAFWRGAEGVACACGHGFFVLHQQIWPQQELVLLLHKLPSRRRTISFIRPSLPTAMVIPGLHETAWSCTEAPREQPRRCCHPARPTLTFHVRLPPRQTFNSFHYRGVAICLLPQTEKPHAPTSIRHITHLIYLAL